MNIHIYYGGRGMIEDPTLYVLSKIENVFGDTLLKQLVRSNSFHKISPKTYINYYQ